MFIPKCKNRQKAKYLWWFICGDKSLLVATKFIVIVSISLTFLLLDITDIIHTCLCLFICIFTYLFADMYTFMHTLIQTLIRTHAHLTFMHSHILHPCLHAHTHTLAYMLKHTYSDSWDSDIGLLPWLLSLIWSQSQALSIHNASLPVT